jgi:hypothetical protein
MPLHSPDDEFFNAVSKPVLPHRSFIVAELVISILTNLKSPMPGEERREEIKEGDQW